MRERGNTDFGYGDSKDKQNGIAQSEPIVKPISDSAGNEKGGQAIGWGASAAIGGGIGYEIGFVTDNNGGRAFYFTFKGNVGIGGDAGMSINNITPTYGGSFSVDDFAGTANSHSLSVGAWGYERGGTTGTNSGIEKAYFMGRNSGIDDRSYITNGGSRGYITPMTKGGLGYMFTESKTWIFKF